MPKPKHKCAYCNTFFEIEEDARTCYDSHDIIFVMLSRSDLNRLLDFMYSKNEKHIGPTLMRNLEKYRRRVAFGKEETI